VKDKIVFILFSFVLFAGLSSSTVTSADSITYNSNNDFFNDEVFNIQVVADQSTDKIDIFLPSSELDSQTEGEVTQDLQIDFTDQSSELRYSTTKSSDLRVVRTFQPHHETGFETEGAAKNEAESTCVELVDTDGKHSTYGIDYDLASFSWEYYCFTEDKYLGTPAFIDNPEEVLSTTVRLEASGKQPLSKTLSNGDAGTGVVTDLGRHAKIRWNGNLDTGASEPNIGRVYGLHANRYSGSWRVISQVRYDDYVNVVEQEGLSQITSWMEGDISKWDAVSTLNDPAWDAAKVDGSSDLAYAGVADSSKDDGAFLYDTADLLSYGMFTVFVNAGEDAYIEVTKPTGEPSIVSTSSVDVNEIGGGTVDVRVRNTGEGPLLIARQRQYHFSDIGNYTERTIHSAELEIQTMQR